MTTRTKGAQAERAGLSSQHPGRIDPEAYAFFESVFEAHVRRMWPSTFHGFENLPEHRDFIVVANHSGMGAAELGALIVGWRDRFGDARPVAGMAHPAGFGVPLLGYLLRGVGAVYATREGAAWARAHDMPLLLFPGGDHEASRPIWRAGEIDFAGRKGWIRLAREHRLHIVPMCITGSHVTNPIVAHGKSIAWLTGVRALGVRRAPLPASAVVAAPVVYGLSRAMGLPRWISALGAWASLAPTLLLPYVPSRIGFHVLPSIAPDRFADPASDDAMYAEVTGLLQRTLDEGSARSVKERSPLGHRDDAIGAGA